MNKYFFHKRIPGGIAILVMGIISILITTSFSKNDKYPAAKTGTLKVIFINTANGKPISLRDSMYSNYFGEQYNISKLKYYISNITMANNRGSNSMGGYYLMNAASEENNFEISLPPGNYNNIEFLLGVDSLRNCSGAQTGALDPMNDMFWTWTSGYVMFKLEGSSPVSTADLQRIEHHIGGYKGANNVATKVNLPFTETQKLEIKENSTTELVIETNLDNYWHSNNEIKIAEMPMCTTTGLLARKVASNFKSLFSIKNIRSIP